MSDSYSDLLLQWLKRTRESQLAHHADAERISRYHLVIGVPATIFSAIVGTAVFATLDTNSTNLNINARVAVATISIITAILTGCQTFLRFSERAEAHRSAAGKYAALRRLIEQQLSSMASVSDAVINEIRQSLDDLSTSSPSVSQRTLLFALKRVGDQYLYSDRVEAMIAKRQHHAAK